MKLPGGKEIKNKPLAIGAGVIGVVVFYIYYQKRKAAAAAVDTTAVDPNAIDPATGIPYSEETGYAQNLSGSSIPNPYVGQGGTVTTSGGAGYTSNVQWIGDAEQYATGYFNASVTLAGSALSKYFAQTPGGLNPDEFQLISELVGLMGPPPVGTFRLIQNNGSTGATGGQHQQEAQHATLAHGVSLRTYSRWNPTSKLDVLLTLNPTLTADNTSHPTMQIVTSAPHLVNN